MDQIVYSTLLSWYTLGVRQDRFLQWQKMSNKESVSNLVVPSNFLLEMRLLENRFGMSDTKPLMIVEIRLKLLLDLLNCLNHYKCAGNATPIDFGKYFEHETTPCSKRPDKTTKKNTPKRFLYSSLYGTFSSHFSTIILNLCAICMKEYEGKD